MADEILKEGNLEEPYWERTETKATTAINDRFADVTLHLSNGEIRCHKLLLCNHSPVLKRMLLDRTKKAKQNVDALSFPNDDSDSMRTMIDCFYRLSGPNHYPLLEYLADHDRDDFDTEDDEIPSLDQELDSKPPVHYQRLWVVAAKYECDKIAKFARKAFEKRLGNYIDMEEGLTDEKAKELFRAVVESIDHYEANSNVSSFAWVRRSMFEKVSEYLCDMVEIPEFFTWLSRYPVLMAALMKGMVEIGDFRLFEAIRFEDFEDVTSNLYDRLVASGEFTALE